MAEGALFTVTALFLGAVFLAAEVFRLRRGRSGRLVAFIRETNPAAGMLVSRAVVLMDTGEKIEAVIPACVMCMGRLCEGDRVLVTENGGEFVVGLASFARRRSGGGACPNDGHGQRGLV